MTGQDILRLIHDRRSDRHCFVKWWRKEEDFLDYDLIDRFIENTRGNEEIGGIDLLTMDDMWLELIRVSDGRISLMHNATGDTVQWVHKGSRGTSTHVCTYSPETLLRIFDVETKGNPVDS